MLSAPGLPGRSACVMLIPLRAADSTPAKGDLPRITALV